MLPLEPAEQYWSLPFLRCIVYEFTKYRQCHPFIPDARHQIQESNPLSITTAGFYFLEMPRLLFRKGEALSTDIFQINFTQAIPLHFVF
tara:strand:+ start:1028 stop:1294 length:267 start_codon:yes stop_codon:yes gene_type:complete